MFKLPFILLGFILFLVGVTITQGFFAFLLTNIGCYVISRSMALDYSAPAFFMIGIIIFGLSFFEISQSLKSIGLNDETSNTIRVFMSLAFGVFTWLSVPKK